MRKVFFATIVAVGAILGGCSGGSDTKSAALKANPLEIDGHFVNAPISSGNVSVYPITLASMNAAPSFPVKPQDEIVSLDDAKKNNWVDIREGTGGMMDNSVSVTNNGPKKVLLMTGELLIGGHQDRVVAQDVVIEPGKTVEVPVFCVEKSRSTGPTDKFEPSGQSVPTSVKMAAIMGEQDAVWSRVDGFNVGAGIAGSALTVNRGLSAEKVKVRTDKGFDQLWTKLTADEKTTGVVVVIDGKIRSLEIFDNRQVFNAGMPSILRGALSEGAVSGFESERLVSSDKVGDFFKVSMRKMEREMTRTGKQGSIKSSMMAGYVMPVNGSPKLIHATFIHTGH